MKPCLLDTDILSEFLRGNPEVVSKTNEYLIKYGHISFSVITYYEILNGLLYKDARKQLKHFIAFSELNKVLPLTTKSAKISANIQAELRKKGTVIGHTDTLIAGIAIAGKLQLITNNVKHFKRVKNLDVSNWKK